MPANAPPAVVKGAEALRSMESQILDASRRGPIEGVVLRYGLFYGPGNPATDHMIHLLRRRMLPVIRNDQGVLPFIHVDDAARLFRVAGPTGVQLRLKDVHAAREVGDELAGSLGPGVNERAVRMK